MVSGPCVQENLGVSSVTQVFLMALCLSQEYVNMIVCVMHIVDHLYCNMKVGQVLLKIML
jgi:hypothetical protein